MSGARHGADDAAEHPAVRWPAPLRRAGIHRHSPIASLAVLGSLDVLLWAVAWIAASGLVALALPLASGPGRGPGAGADTGSGAAVTTGIVLLLGLVAVLAQLGLGAALGLYRHRDAVGSPAELRTLGLVAAGVLLLLIGTGLLARPVQPGPLAVLVVIAWLLALLLMILARQALRAMVDRERRPRDGERVVVLGAGVIGTSLTQQMLRDPRSPYLPVALVDDDPAKRHLRTAGVSVRGTTDQLCTVIRKTGAAGVIVAIDDARPQLLTSLTARLEGTGVWLRRVPSVTEMLGRTPEVGAIRDLDVADLIGRSVSRPDLSAASSLISGRRILVTGAGGSIGSELCRQIHALGPAALLMLDRDESALHALSMSLSGRALLDSPEFVLADIRDPAALDAVFAAHRPEIVFHAAALKHLPMLERHPAEAWKTNVHGTRNVLEAALAHGVGRFVNVSTDKAARPTSMLGRSKRIAEGLTAQAAEHSGRDYVNVRFGNVIGSRGSAIPAFAEQIRAGGPVTVTHPDVTRYFMTIPEACELVLFALTVGHGGETLVLEMGEPVRIVDVVERMMTLSGRHCPITFTGLRPGEKLTEELFTPDEQEILRRSDRICHVRGLPLPPADLPEPEAPVEQIEAYCAQALAEHDALAPTPKEGR